MTTSSLCTNPVWHLGEWTQCVLYPLGFNSTSFNEYPFSCPRDGVLNLVIVDTEMVATLDIHPGTCCRDVQFFDQTAWTGAR